MKKLLKKIVCCALSAATMLTMSVSVNISSFASDKLTGLTADQIVDEMTVGWNLGNSLDSISQNGSPSPQESVTAWGNPEPSQELIKKVKETGFNTIRIPITWYQHLTYDSSADKYIVKSDWMQYVKKVVDWAYNMDMFVIINVHHEDWVNVSHFTDDTLNTAKKKLGDIWSQVAEEFKDYDQHLIFEGMNEPRETYDSSVEWGDGNSNSWSYINTLNSVFVSTIRNNGEGNNPERLLMIPAYHASDSAVPLNNLTIPDNAGNIALSVHAYEPYSFTMDTSESHIYESTNKWGIYNPDTVASVMHSLKNISESKNVPIILGEFSASDFNNTSERVKWAKDYVSQATQNGFVCVLWDNNCTYSGSANSENHGYFNRADNSIYANSKDVLEAIIEAAGQEYTEPEPDEFWNTVTIGDNWVKLEKFDNGVSVSQYSGYKLSADMSYIKEGYKLAIVHNGSTAPKLVLESNDGKYTWVQVDAESTENHISYYNYNDIMTALNNSGYTISQIGNIIGQVMVESKVYGLYAVPVSSDSSSVSDSSSKADSSSKVESSSQAESSSEAESSSQVESSSNVDSSSNTDDVIYEDGKILAQKVKGKPSYRSFITVKTSELNSLVDSVICERYVNGKLVKTDVIDDAYKYYVVGSTKKSAPSGSYYIFSTISSVNEGDRLEDVYTFRFADKTVKYGRVILEGTADSSSAVESSSMAESSSIADSSSIAESSSVADSSSAAGTVTTIYEGSDDISWNAVTVTDITKVSDAKAGDVITVEVSGTPQYGTGEIQLANSNWQKFESGNTVCTNGKAEITLTSETAQYVNNAAGYIIMGTPGLILNKIYLTSK